MLSSTPRSGRATHLGNLFDELKRRNVFRVGAAYVVVGWLIAQAGDLSADNLGFPDWFMPMMLVVLALGFPIALIVAWAFELTPDGIRRDNPKADLVKPPLDLHQEIQFCQTTDGVRLAYGITGTGETLVKAATWMTHLEEDLQSLIWGYLIRDISSYRRMIRHDQRGNGLSDRKVETISPDLLSSDLEVVMEAAGVEKCALLGISQGSAVAIEFAVKYPDRVTHLILMGGFAHSSTKHGGQEALETHEALKELIRVGWGQENATFRQVFTSMFFPNAEPDIANEFDKLQSTTASAESAAQIFQAISEIDIDDLLCKVSVPTLVLHCKGDIAVPIAAGRFIASEIPNAKFVTLDSDNHLPHEHELASKQLVKEIRAFLS